jgi:hypothetical protein
MTIAAGSRVRLRYAGHKGTVVRVASNGEDTNVLWDGDPWNVGPKGMWHFAGALELI